MTDCMSCCRDGAERTGQEEVGPPPLQETSLKIVGVCSRTNTAEGEASLFSHREVSDNDGKT